MEKFITLYIRIDLSEKLLTNLMVKICLTKQHLHFKTLKCISLLTYINITSCSFFNHQRKTFNTPYMFFFFLKFSYLSLTPLPFNEHWNSFCHPTPFHTHAHTQGHSLIKLESSIYNEVLIIIAIWLLRRRFAHYFPDYFSLEGGLVLHLKRK